MKTLFVLAHGAGAGSSSEWMKAWKKRLAPLGTVAAFDYPYVKAGRKAPDKMPKLLEAHRAVLAAKRKGFPRVVLIGKSMGSRVGCHLALEEKVDRLVCLGYPLRSPKGDLRDEVLKALRTPVLFVQGTRDPLCPLDALKGVMKKMKAKRSLHVVETGNHSLQITAKHARETGATQDDADAAALAAIRSFIS
jgi:predicted alpha/beta-hydrolase family hydrolase